MTTRLALVMALGAALTVCTSPVVVPDSSPSTESAPARGLSNEDIPPELGTGFRKVQQVRSQRSMVGSANPYASRAGLEMLEAGGSAVDANIAMALVLTLVEPQSSGIGGGGFMLHFSASDGRLDAYDGRETAPSAARPGRFLDADGRPREFYDAVVGGLSVGVPGVLRMFELAHRQHGKLPWAQLFEPAIRLAEHGFQVSPRLHALLDSDQYLRETSAAMDLYYGGDGEAAAVGTTLINRPLAEVLRAVAEGGAAAFYSGPIAADIAAAVQHAPRNPASLTVADLGAYKAVRREAICRPYRGYKVCGMPPPTSGGIAALQILGILSNFDLAKLDRDSVEAAHLFTEASRLAYADRGRYVADSDFVKVPVYELLDPGYLRQRAALIEVGASMGKAKPGVLGGAAATWPSDRSLELPSTSHMVAVDADGNAVSMTDSIESAFGSRIMVRGFLLNNELTDFSFVPEVDGRPVANRVQPGKRPRSSMSPMLVFDSEGKFKMAVGSPGGSRIIPYTTGVLISVLDWKMGVQAAIDRPHVINRNGVTEVEILEARPRWTTAMVDGLKALGHEAVQGELNSGLQAIVAVEGGYTGGADPRREGLIVGQ